MMKLFTVIALLLLIVKAAEGRRGVDNKLLTRRTNQIERTVYETGFWLKVQQWLVVGLLTLACIFAIYTLIIPLKYVTKRSLQDDDFMKHSMIFILQSIDPVDLTFGVMNVTDEVCMKKVICEAGKIMKVMPRGQEAFQYTEFLFPGFEKYSDAIEVATSSHTCEAVYPECKPDIFSYVNDLIKDVFA